MSKLRLTFFGKNGRPNSEHRRSDQQDAPAQQPHNGHSTNGVRPSRFQLRRTEQPRPEMEWEWGRDDNKLFELQKDTSLSPVDTKFAHGAAVPRSRSPRLPDDLERWRRPSAETTTVSANPQISTSSALVGEIISTGNGTYDNRSHSTPDVKSATSPVHNGHRTAQPASSEATIKSPLLKPFTGEEGTRRVLATRIALDEALDRWWTNGEHAPLALLRDGLLALEAGHELDETQRSFLLRTALRTGRGIVTALHYQIDADRTAFLFKEALLDTKQPFDPGLINYLRQHDDQSEEWVDYLEHDLAYEATVASGKRSQLAATALHTIQMEWPAPVSSTQAEAPAPHSNTHLLQNQSRANSVTNAPRGKRRANGGLIAKLRAYPADQLRPLSHQWSLRWLFWSVLMFFVVLRLGWPQLISSAPMVEIPAGTYMISDSESSDPANSDRFRTISLDAYAIDRHEVTNVSYRRCWEQNACPIPSSFDSQSHPGYFVNRAFNDYPVVNVDWEAAQMYCAWMGKRLPTLEEWEVAASLAPVTGLRYTYPWGERFDARLVNSAVSNLHDTQAVGTYHPAGSTPLGIMDMAGNVAEWTSMPAASIIDGVVVKGGSYQDPPEQLRNDALVELPRMTSTPWLGFRCAIKQ